MWSQRFGHNWVNEWSLNYKLVVAKSICQWLNTKRVFHISCATVATAVQCWTPRLESEALCAPGKLVELVFRWFDIFRNWFHDPNPFISSYPEKHWIPSWWNQLLMASRKGKVGTWLHWTPHSPTSYLLTFLPLPLWSSLSELSEVLPPGL